MCHPRGVEGSGHHDRVGRSYDAVAGKYADAYGGELAGKPLDRALLACLIEQAGQGAPIADIGCGPGHIAAWIAGHGRAAVGIDLSAGMVAAASRAYPDAEFREGDFLDLPARDGEFGAVVAFYSIILASLPRPSGRPAVCCGPAASCWFPSTSVPKSGTWNNGGART